ncbi:MAG: C69 family dipeptidase [Candidatus Hadarchaeum sp.]
MRKVWMLPLLVWWSFAVCAQGTLDVWEKWERWERGEIGCTSIVVGKNASVDGSVMTTHTCDGWYDPKLWIVPGATHAPGETVKIYKYRLTDNPLRPPTIVGEIPQVERTYTYFHIAYPFLNENQVAIGETTIGGRRELINTLGMFYIEELEAIALQRARTAREAIQIMGELAEKYGYADAGECLTVIDPNEAWVFEIFGPGPFWTPDSGKPGAVWVAQRVPDDEVFVSANRSRIGEIDLSRPDWFMASSNIYSLAQEMGWWDPNSGVPFRVYEIYGPKDSFYNSRREWRVFDLIAPSKGFDPWARRYPFSVKPDQKLSVADLMKINRDHYEGTDFDLTKGLAAGPYENPNRWPTSPDRWERAISMFRCSYSFVAQCRSWLPNHIGGVLWFGLHAPSTTCYIPIYCGVTALPQSLQIRDPFKFSRDSAWWAFAFVHNYANLWWNLIIKDIQALQYKFEREFLAMQPAIETAAVSLYQNDPALARTFLTNYCVDAINRVVSAWWDLADALVSKYHDGYIWADNKRTAIGYPNWWLEAVDFGKTTDLNLYKDIFYDR